MLSISRRRWIQGSMALAASAAAPALKAQPSTSRALPAPIGKAERMARLAKARRLMEREGLGSIIIEPGASLDYFTGVRWSRSERLTAAVIPVSGPPLIVTPFFEKPSVAESLQVDADIRTWDEHEEPLRTVAGILHETKVAGQPIGIEETNRFFIVDRLKQQYPKAVTRNANGVVRGCRMIKSPAELALMQEASDITLDAIREMHGKLKSGMTPDDISTLLEQAMVSRGGSSPWALVLIGEAAAYPHGSGKPQVLRPGEILLVDTGCAVRGYQADISRTFVFGAAPTADQRRVWEQVAQGQKIAMQAARIGVTAGSVDDAVRAAYTRWGYGPDYKLPGLSHRTGHGIGMEGHEPINLVRGEATTLAPGMCFSNEPGIYIPGKFGVRLEDCFHMTAAGPKWFSVPPASIDDPFGRSGA
ncbi:Xaa-Pro peptidase family protein [Sphingomonas sp. LY29]|uniref:M24 family metallopeptidase n=1 Tax=Sphingomonas sp. LY29 TaxID=3095341 RepID=UPI002D769A2F|nr:Xaa-Pro peptidase family protein [Sphingomonas sp. LY29]WRP26004.1 Xaa-Pro peptidase family protein [Sphingomonas sp. LY29]